MLELRNVTKAFGNLKAVDDLDMDVTTGTIHGLIGPNGSGKSTTMNLISGAFAPTNGSIRFERTPIGGLGAHRIARRGIVRTFQLTRIYGSGTVFHAVRTGALAGNGSPWNPRQWRPLRRDTEAAEVARAALDRMGLSEVADWHAGSLPGGMQRMLSMATALAARPRLLLLDEPLAGLNASEKAQVAGRIEHLRDNGITILLVEHDVRSVMRLCDRITVINFGQVIATGTPADIARDDRVIEAYLGHRRSAHAQG